MIDINLPAAPSPVPSYAAHRVRDAQARRLLAELGPRFAADTVRVLVDGDLVAVHGVLDGPDGARAGFDIFRVADGEFAEHWAAHQRVVADTASGHSQTDGLAEVTRPGQSARSGRLVGYLVDTILVGGKHDRLRHFFSSHLIQHDPLVGNGLQAMADDWRSNRTVYDRRLLTIAEGEFVLTVSTGTQRHAPRVFYDLFRVDRGMIVERWNVVTVPPPRLPEPASVAAPAPAVRGAP
jgi:predicted SnoaL-like aldol condensation-catalyzing enzyme